MSFSGARTRSLKRRIETIDLNNYLSGLVVKSPALSTILTSFGNHISCSKLCMKLTKPQRPCPTVTAWGIDSPWVALSGAQTFGDSKQVSSALLHNHFINFYHDWRWLLSWLCRSSLLCQELVFALDFINFAVNFTSFHICLQEPSPSTLSTHQLKIQFITKLLKYNLLAYKKIDWQQQQNIYWHAAEV